MRIVFLVYCIASLFYYVFVFVSCPYVIYYPTVMARYSLFVLKVPLNPKQASKQTNKQTNSCLTVIDCSCSFFVLCEFEDFAVATDVIKGICTIFFYIFLKVRKIRDFLK